MKIWIMKRVKVVSPKDQQNNRPCLGSRGTKQLPIIVILITKVDTHLGHTVKISRELDAFGSWRLHRGLLRVWQLPLTYCSTYIKILYTWLNGSCQTINKIPLGLNNPNTSNSRAPPPPPGCQRPNVVLMEVSLTI